MALCSTSSILTCQPLPLLRKCSTISASNLAVNCTFGRSDFGRPRRGASKASTVSGGNRSASASHPTLSTKGAASSDGCRCDFLVGHFPICSGKARKLRKLLGGIYDNFFAVFVITSHTFFLSAVCLSVADNTHSPVPRGENETHKAGVIARDKGGISGAP